MKLPVTPPWQGDTLLGRPDGLTVLGQLGESLDGQIATQTGQSKYINGPGGLEHLHRLRAWADVVVVGVGTVVADNPKLNVRLVPGESPDRVIIDPSARLPGSAYCLSMPGRTVVLTASGASHTDLPAGVTVHAMPLVNGYLDAAHVRQWLAQQGWRRVLIEGGASTLRQFLLGGQVDYLHLIMSPLLLGPGIAGVRAALVSHLQEAPRFKASVQPLGTDVLIECAFA